MRDLSGINLWLVSCLVALVFSGEVRAIKYPAPGLAVFGPGEGLRQTTITSLCKTKDGFLWVGTHAGLHRFDGLAFEHLASGHSELADALSSTVRDMAESGGYLYVSTEQYVFRVETRTLRAELIADMGAPGRSCILFPFSEDCIRFIRFNHREGLYEWKKGGGEPRLIKEFSLTDGFRSVGKEENTLWVMTREGLHSARFTSENELIWTREKTEDELSLFWSRSCGDVYFISDSGIGRIRNGQRSLLVPGNFTEAMQIHPRSGGFVSTDASGELRIWDDSGRELCQLKGEQFGFGWKLDSRKVTSVHWEPDGTLFLGIDGLGLMRIQHRYFVLNEPISLASRGMFVRSLLSHETGLYAAVFPGRLVRFEEGKTDVFVLPEPGDSPRFMSGLDAERILLASERGLYVFNPTSGFELIKTAGLEMRLANFAKTEDGRIYAAFLNGPEIFEIVENRKLVSVRLLTRSSQRVKAIFACGGNRLLLAYSEGGFAIISPGSSAKTEIGLPGQVIVSDYYEYGTYRWLTTSKGLYVMDEAGIASQPDFLPERLKSEWLFSVIQPSDDNLWLGGVSGLWHFHLSSLRLSHFTESDGLTSNEFNARSKAILPDGRIVLGTVNGLHTFRPASMAVDEWAPPPIAFFDAENHDFTDIGGMKVFEFSETSVALRFRMVSPYLSMAEANMYSYALDNGRGLNWSSPNPSREVFISALASGSYTVYAKASNSSGIWSLPVPLFSIVVKPVFYKTWWFLITVGMAMASVLGYILFLQHKRKNERRLAELEKAREVGRMRQRIADDMHDDLGVGLTRLTILLRKAKKANQTDDKLWEPLTNLTSDLNRSLRMAVWTTAPEEEEPKNPVRIISEYTRDCLSDTGIDVLIETPDEDNCPWLSLENRQAALYVLKEALNNIIKYSGATTVKVTIGWDDIHFSLLIEDNGRGFDPQDARIGGNGRHTMSRRAAEAGGNLEVHSVIGVHTKVWLTLALKAQARS